MPIYAKMGVSSTGGGSAHNNNRKELKNKDIENLDLGET